MTTIALYGYGEVAKGVELAACASPDVRIFGVFTRRAPSLVQTRTGVPVYGVNRLFELPEGALDVVVLCAASPDLAEICPNVAARFCTVDGNDMHAALPAYLQRVDEACKAHKTTAFVAGGWDPGLFSLARLFGEAFLPDGKTYTFWGSGVSQGHTAALKRVKGVKDGVQYTVPKPSALDALRRGETPDWRAQDLHERECYVVAEEGVNEREIEREIAAAPYFQGYRTKIVFVDGEELREKHAARGHGGRVIRVGRTAERAQNFECSLALSSNPGFTGSALLACARATQRLHAEQQYGAKTIFDVPPVYFASKPRERLVEELL